MTMKNSDSNLIGRGLGRVRAVYNEYPSQYWVLVTGTFIDRLGGALLFPFFTLYITRKFDVGMTQVGVIFAMFSLSSVVGGFFGGALTDRLGRKGMLLFGLITSALSSLLMGVVGTIEAFFFVTLFVGLLSNTGGPAQQAMVADLLPEEKRAQGFGILRVVVNLAVTIGPMIGGLLAARSYMWLFISDAVASLITAVIVYFVLQESMAPREAGAETESLAKTMAGYRDVLRDLAYVWFLAASVLMVLVYMQMNTTLSVYLRDVHGIPEQGFGYILSLNAAMVVLFQFPITRWVSKYRPLMVMTAGTVLYAIGFAMYGFVSAYVLFLVAMAIITIGEMFVSPVGQAIVARLAPEDMRGRYMAIFGFSWVIPMAIGPLLAGLVMDNFDPDWVWYGAGILGFAAAGAYYLLELQVRRTRWAVADARLAIMEQVELGQLTAEDASRQLEGVSQGVWARLATDQPLTARRHMRIRVSEPQSSTVKIDLRLPVGLVNMVMDSGGRLSNGLGYHEDQGLQAIIAHRSSAQRTNDHRAMDVANGDNQRVEIIFEHDDDSGQVHS
jgi:MFS family permease